MARVVVQVIDEKLDPYGWFSEVEPQANVGAVAAFVGMCRDEGGRLSALELEHYAGMAEAEMTRIAQIACARWPLDSLLAVHRSGLVAAGEPIVLVVAGSSHRDAAFDAVRFVMDFLKTDAPFWKREHLADGSRGPWVDAAVKDDAARERWAQG